VYYNVYILALFDRCCTIWGEITNNGDYGV